MTINVNPILRRSRPFALSQVPPALEAAHPNPQRVPESPARHFTRTPLGASVPHVDPFLTTGDRVQLMQVSAEMGHEVHKSNRLGEAKEFRRERRVYVAACRRVGSSARLDSYHRSLYASERLRAEASYLRVCIRIADARANRGDRVPFINEIRQLTHLLADWDQVTASTLLECEQSLVECWQQSCESRSMGVRAFFRKLCKLQEANRAVPRNLAAIREAKESLKNSLEILHERLLALATADLRTSNDAVRPSLPPQQLVVYVEHPSTSGATFTQQVHVGRGGKTLTQRQDWPEPVSGMSRVRFVFDEAGLEERYYVHTRRVPAALDMDAPD